MHSLAPPPQHLDVVRTLTGILYFYIGVLWGAKGAESVSTRVSRETAARVRCALFSTPVATRCLQSAGEQFYRTMFTLAGCVLNMGLHIMTEPGAINCNARAPRVSAKRRQRRRRLRQLRITQTLFWTLRASRCLSKSLNPCSLGIRLGHFGRFGGNSCRSGVFRSFLGGSSSFGCGVGRL